MQVGGCRRTLPTHLTRHAAPHAPHLADTRGGRSWRRCSGPRPEIPTGGSEGRRGGSSGWDPFPLAIGAHGCLPRSACRGRVPWGPCGADMPRGLARCGCDALRRLVRTMTRGVPAPLWCVRVYTYTSLWPLVANVGSAQYCGSRKA